MAMKQQRDDHRFEEQLPVQVHVKGMREAIPALTADLNPFGVGFRSTQRIEPGSQVTIQLPIMPQRILTTGVVKHVEAEATRLGRVFMHGVEFGELAMEDRDAIELYCTQHSMPMWRIKYRQSVDIVTRVTEVVRNLRGGRRRLVGLPARVQSGTTSPARFFILEDYSSAGARLIGDAPIAPGTTVSFDVPGASVKGTGTVRHVQSLQTDLAVLFSMGVEFPAVPRRRWLPRREAA
jgi:hypothetical protein